MKKVMNKGIMQKIIILIVIVLTFNFVVPTYSQADFGGTLMGPIIDFFAGIGDAVISALQYFMYDGAIDVGFVEGTTETLSAAFTLVNPFDSFLLERVSDNTAFFAKLEQYGAGAYQMPIDIEIDVSQFDKGWLGWLPGSWADKNFGVPIIKYTPEKIFANKVPALDVNFIDPIDWSDPDVMQKYGISSDDAQNMNARSISRQLHSTIATWYIALRNLAIVALLSVLLYVGIRMVISSTASDKAKYKQMLFDWVVALCLVFFIHYIMSFVLTITEMITEGIGGASEIVVGVVNDPDGNFQFRTDLTGLCRFQIQYADLSTRLIYLIFYIALVIYTVLFTWTYVKRAVKMAFLTLIAPLVAITYPIDKISDGQAQAFGTWLKEYVFNALLQPFHLILYTIFLSSAMNIVITNPIFAIMFLAFIGPAEKLLRKMFGFDKADAGSGFMAGVGGAAAYKMLSSIGSRRKASTNATTKSNDKVRMNRNIESNDSPQGYSAFANDQINTREQIGAQQNATEEERTPQQQMLDAYDENYGTPEWNPQERDAMAREANSQTAGMQYTADELREAGLDEESIRVALGEEQMSAQGQQNNNNATQVPTTQAGNIRTQDTPQQNNNAERPLTRRARVLNGFKNIGRQTFNRQNAKQLGIRALKTAGRATVRTATTGLGLTLGLAAGITGGDLEDVLKYGSAGAVLGNRTFGNIALNQMSSAQQYIGRNFAEGYYGVNEAAMRRQARDFKNNQENRDYFATEFATDRDQKLSGRELNTLMDRAAYYNNNDITDNSAIKKSIKLEDSIKREMANLQNVSDEDKTKMAREQATTIAKIASSVDDNKLKTDPKYEEGLMNNFRRGLKKSNPSMTDRDLGKQSDQMMKLLKQYKKID